ncbi:flavoprotein [Melissospora conviva]|uniref:flavoprotein n=1 Tax=Melissospora conviva TaxID=3388432 RepID=UPI003C291F29
MADKTGRPVLYLVACAAPPALTIGETIALLQDDGWTVCLIPTPTTATWIDVAALAEQTGYPVRADWRKPQDPRLLPDADAVLVAPATFNTINKWALGNNDNYALGILNESLGQRLPMIVYPYARSTLTSHPAYAQHVALLHAAGVSFPGIDGLQKAASGDRLPWASVQESLRPLHGTRQG